MMILTIPILTLLLFFNPITTTTTTTAPFVPQVVDELDSSNFDIFDDDGTIAPIYTGPPEKFQDF